MRSLNMSNAISCLRAPLALFFLSSSVSLRVTSVLLAMFTDGLDGYLARRTRSVTQLGAMLDPLMDKFFVFFTGSVLLIEGALQPWQLLCLMSRDFSVAFFGFYLMFTGRLTKVNFQSIWSGKVSTLIQFGVLISLTIGASIPTLLYFFFILLAATALLELFLLHGTRPSQV